MKHNNKFILGAAICLLINSNLGLAAASTNNTTQSGDTEATSPSSQPNPSHQAMLTHLLAADLALQRNMYAEALEHYLIVAKTTNDPQIAQMATELALETQNMPLALQSVQIWANAAPNNMQAQLIAIALFINEDPSKSKVFLNNALQHNPNELDQNLVIVLEQLPPTGKQRLTQIMYALADQYPKNPYAQLAAAQLSAVQLDIKAANTKLTQALALDPTLTNAIELQAKLIRHEKNDDQPALDYLSKQVQKNPKDNSLRMFYVLALLDNNQASVALPHLKILSKDPKFAGDAYLLISEDEINQGKYKAAEATMKHALEYENSVDKARYYLAQLAEYNKNNTAAIGWYEQVESRSEYHTSAYLRAAYLYSLKGEYSNALNTLQSSEPSTFEDQKQILLTEIDILIESNDLDKALESTNRVLEVLPNDVDFLYARSTVNSILHKYPAAERDLKLVLSQDPNNANALNALGFILSSQPDRVKEALPFIQRAMALNPDNPAFMDTLGWYYYKSGKTADAIAMLEKAYKLSGDNEIAAHLGEVLWTSGQQAQARAVWQKALQSAENKASIHETLTRLNIPVTDVTNKPSN